MNLFRSSPAPCTRGRSRSVQGALGKVLMAVAFCSLLSLVGFKVAQAAWTPPSAPPPGGNVSAPINVSGAAQTKQGSLTIAGEYLSLPAGGLFFSSNPVLSQPHINFSSNSLYLSPGDDGDHTEIQGKVKITQAGGNPGELSVQNLDSCASLETDENGKIQCSAGGGGYWSQQGNSLFLSNPAWNVGIGTNEPSAKLDVAGPGFFINPSGGSHWTNYHIGQNRDPNNPADLILLIPAHTAGLIEASIMNGVLTANRGSSGSWNSDQVWYLAVSSAYDRNVGSLTPFSEQASRIQLVTFDYNGSKWLGLDTTNIGWSSHFWSFTGTWLNSINAQKPTVIPRGDVNNIRSFKSYQSLGNDLYFPAGGGVSLADNLVNSPVWTDNLFRNGNFEQGSLDGFVPYGPTNPQSTQNYSSKIGQYNLYIQARPGMDCAGNFCGVVKPMPDLSPGTTYTISYWARAVSNAGEIRFSNQNGAGDENCLSHTVTLTGQWQKFSRTCTLDVAKNQLYIWSNTPSQEWVIDGLQLEPNASVSSFTSGLLAPNTIGINTKLAINDPSATDATQLSVKNSSTNAAIYAEQQNAAGYAGYFSGKVGFTNRIRFFGDNVDGWGPENSDPYSLQKVHDAGNVSHLDLQLNDDWNEEFRIYGNSCVGYDCGETSGNLYHFFRSDGTAYHSGNVGIGTTTPNNLLTVSKDLGGAGNGAIIMRVEGTNSSDTNYTLFEAGHGAGRAFIINGAGNVSISSLSGGACTGAGTVKADANGTLYCDTDLQGGGGNYWKLNTATDPDYLFLDDVTVPDPNTRVGIGTQTPEFKLTLDTDGGILAKGTFGSGADLVTSGAGTRLIWYPKKSAFRAGYADTQWDDNNIGNYSTAIGYETMASDEASFAAGFRTTASGFASTAMGESSIASGTNSIALGRGTTASSFESTALGRDTIASGFASTAMGSNTTASGFASTAMGEAATASEFVSIALGRYVTASAQNSIVIGNGVGADNRLINNRQNSLMIGFNSDIPTIFVNSSSGVGTTGFVGIGDVSPLALLTVGDDDKFQVNASGDIIKISNVTYSWPAAQGNNNTFLKNDGNGNLAWAAAGGGLPAGNNGDTLRYNGGWVTNNFLYNDDSKIGIGTQNPSQRLTVKGAAGATNETLLVLEKDSAWENAEYLALDFANDGGTVISRIASYLDDVNDYNLQFFTTTNGGTNLVKQMTITDNGNVGIKSDNPGSLLELSTSGSPFTDYHTFVSHNASASNENAISGFKRGNNVQGSGVYGELVAGMTCSETGICAGIYGSDGAEADTKWAGFFDGKAKVTEDFLVGGLKKNGDDAGADEICLNDVCISDWAQAEPEEIQIGNPNPNSCNAGCAAIGSGWACECGDWDGDGIGAGCSPIHCNRTNGMIYCICLRP